MYTVAPACAGPGDNELFDLLERRKTEIEAVMANSPGTSKLHAWVLTAARRLAVSKPKSRGGRREHSGCEGMDATTRIGARLKPA